MFDGKCGLNGQREHGDNDDDDEKTEEGNETAEIIFPTVMANESKSLMNLLSLKN